MLFRSTEQAGDGVGVRLLDDLDAIVNFPVVVIHRRDPTVRNLGRAILPGR